jgi:hypothetical protein
MVALNFIESWRAVASPHDIQLAFRAGLLGLHDPYGDPENGLEEAAAGFAHGPCESAMIELARLPGLDHERRAFETGRAMTAIARLLDQARAPASVALQFRDNVAAAVMTHRMRRLGRSWGADETVGMFMEMYDRILGEDDLKADLVRRRILDYALQRR